MIAIQNRIRTAKLKTSVGVKTVRPIFPMKMVQSPPHVLIYMRTAKRHACENSGASLSKRDVAIEALIEDFSKDVFDELMRQFEATMKFLEDQNFFKEMYKYSIEAYPEVYEKSDGLTLKLWFDGEKFEELFEKKYSKKDRDQIDKYFKGWDKNVHPERMEDVINHYTPKAAAIGGSKALRELGVGFEFNLKNPELLEQIKDRGAKITGGISQTSLNQFRDTFGKMYYEEGLSPYELKRRIKGIFPETYKNRAKTIARTEARTAQMATQFETYKKNYVTRKRWFALVDERTRDSHISVDGEVQDIDEPFSNGLMFPLADGPANETINCRCDFQSWQVEVALCKADIKDDVDCKVPWTGGAEDDPPVKYDKGFKDVYAKSIKEGCVGVMQLVKMPDEEIALFLSYLETNQTNKAYGLLAKYSGRQGSTVAKMPKGRYKKAKAAYTGCKDI